MRRPVVLVGLTLTVVTAAGISLWQGKGGVPMVRETARPAAPGSAAATVRPRERSRLLDATPASLRGTTVDGAVHLGADGRLVVNVSLRRYLDYFLSAQGERDLFALRADALQASGLSSHGQVQLAAFFDRYVDYLSDLPLVSANDPAQALRERRVRHFGSRDEAALFADLEKTADAIAHRRTQHNAEPALQNSEAWRELVVLQARWKNIQESRRQEERRKLYGTRPAERMRRLDQQRGAWDEQVAGLRRQLTGLEGAARRHALQRMLDTAVPAYSPAQRRRLLALLALP